MSAAGVTLPSIPRLRSEGAGRPWWDGVVYKALHKKLNRSIAIKMLLAGLYASPGERKRFIREAEAIGVCGTSISFTSTMWAISTGSLFAIECRGGVAQ